MKLWATTVRIFTGDYEKCETTFRKAESEDDAAYAALVGQTHNTPLTREEYDNGEEWWDDYMVYRIDHVKECPPELEALLKASDVYVF